MRQIKRKRNRKTMVVLGSVALLLGAVNTAAAAPPTEPVIITLNEPVAACEGLAGVPVRNEVTVTASVDSNVELTGFNVRVSRWEHVTVASPDDFDGLGQVEDWNADFWNRGRKGQAIPTSHTLTTNDKTTWSYHGWKTSGYSDTSDLFVVSVNAYAAGKGNTEGTGKWDSWVIDCLDLDNPSVEPFISPWDAPWESEQGDL